MAAAFLIRPEAFPLTACGFSSSDKGQADVDGKWMRQSWHDIQKYKDGITTDSQGLSPLLCMLSKILPPLSLEKTDEFWLNTLKNTHVGTADAYGFIAVRNLEDDEQVVKAGQLWQRIHLWGTAKGIGLHIMNQLSERRDRELSVGLKPHFGDRLHDILGDSMWNSIIQFRMGYPTREALPSPRRPVTDVIV
jgi:hypothetical protein